MSIFEAIQLCVENNLIFAAYRIPNEDNIEMLIQRGDTLNLLNSIENYNSLKGFVVTPFEQSDCCQPFIINPDIYFTGNPSQEITDDIRSLKSIPIVSDITHTPEEISHDEYICQLDIIINEIKKGIFEKVVPSRVKVVNGNYASSLSDIYSRLCLTYKNAFVYIFNAGPHLWIGATPELLLKTTNGTMNTVSLAGTRPYLEQNLNIGAWNSKERLEQEYVTRYITGVLSKFNLKGIELEGPYAKKAGNLVHLRTDFSFNSNDLKDKFGAFLAELHPTPAVCGMPKQQSIQLIKSLEKHKRGFYSGFLGPIGLKERLELFVNLRCMKVLEENLALFVGGGITADSVPEDEWQETEIKAETLLSIIRQIKQ